MRRYPRAPTRIIRTERPGQPDETLSFVGVCVGVWLTAYMMGTRRLCVALLEERAAAAGRECDHLIQIAAAVERAELARELHDVVAHSLAVMIVQADGANYVISTNHDKARKAMQTIADIGRDSVEDMRRIVEVCGARKGLLSGTMAPRGGVGLAHLKPLVERACATGLRVDLDIEGEPQGLSTTDELTLSGSSRNA
ncbi:histidine kinase dimerization/phosphoacceptor domain-containing protein [Streptomyces sp. NPDC093516]|uniref:sensor histidine kinase n=1 Tax=Streptomyces sp. NPDC093516 TaxID=3155304 RepID=UPI00343DCFAF